MISADASAEMGSGLEVALGWCCFWPLVSIGLSHRPEPTAETIKVAGAALAASVARHQVEPNPDHSMLGCEESNRDQRAELVAALRPRIREAGRNLVAPFELPPHWRSGVFEEFLQFRTESAIVSR